MDQWMMDDGHPSSIKDFRNITRFAKMRASLFRLILAFYALDYSSEPYARGHGRLMEPPSRSSLWRFREFDQYSPPKNYDDNELFCGGFKVQYGLNKGRCGPCGDPYNATVPRDNESGGGMYALGIITRDYRMGQVIDVGVQLTRSHKGTKFTIEEYHVLILCTPFRKCYCLSNLNNTTLA